MFKRKNRFDVQIAFPSGRAIGLKSTEVPLTPEDVIGELKWFIERAEKLIASHNAKLAISVSK